MASEEDKLIHIWTTNISFSSAFLSQMTIIIFHPPNNVYTASSNSNQFTFFMWKYPFTISKPFPLWFNGKNHSIANPVQDNLNPHILKAGNFELCEGPFWPQMLELSRSIMSRNCDTCVTEVTRCHNFEILALSHAHWYSNYRNISRSDIKWQNWHPEV